MALTSWADQMPVYNGYFASTSEVAALARKALSGRGEDGMADMRDSMDACKADLKDRLESLCQDKYPDCVAYYKGIYDRARRLPGMLLSDGFLPLGYLSVAGSLLSADSGISDTPGVFVSVDTPTTEFDGQAKNGTFCWDQANSIIYVNRGTLDANSWQIFDSQDLVNYLANPEQLHLAFMYGSVFFLFEKRATDATGTNEVLSLQFYEEQEERFCKKYEDYVKRAFGGLKIDYSNNGTINSLGKKLYRSQRWGMR
jgi:hypothetical protein